MTTIEDVRERLGEVRPVGAERDIVAAGLVREVRLDGSEVCVRLLAGGLAEAELQAVVADIRRGVGALDGVERVDVQVVGGSTWAPGGDADRSATAEQASARSRDGEPRAPETGPLPGVRDIIAVSSTKGGVGKSTVAVNLACALARLGRRVGLLDADVYGPSVPTMLGLAGRPGPAEGSRIVPHERFGVRAMSIGFFLDDASPVIWRGPLVTGLLRQFLRDVDWGEIDVLVIDMPPGTGDAQLTLVQQVPIAGGIVVTTPQEVSLRDVERGVAMFHQVNTPILGVVENMSYYDCPECGEREELFGSGGGGRLEREFGVPLLGRIPLVPELRESGDAGEPLVVGRPEHPVSRAMLEIAARVLDALEAEGERASAPRIIG